MMADYKVDSVPTLIVQGRFDHVALDRRRAGALARGRRRPGAAPAQGLIAAASAGPPGARYDGAMLESLPAPFKTVALLAASNVFMTFAWYAPPARTSRNGPGVIAALVSWGIALFEYLLQVPANRIGYERA